ncbi:MAG: hypothetical protein JKY93_07355, partial [Gammaproteobacteria bacterium]|nr:hypothetical protein [Gammaproteobacteria bacterium]
MKGIFKQSIILVIVAITVAACSTKQPANIMTLNNINNLKFLSHDELGDVEAVLNNTDTKHYDYRIVSIEGQKQGARKLLVKKKGGFNGLLFMYNKKHLNPLGGAFYSDQQGSLLRFADRDKAFAVTYMADGRKILAIDGNRDGAIETLVGNIGVDDFWIISDEIASLLPCLSSSGGHVYDAIFDCTRPQASGGSGGSGGANAGGGSSNTPDFGSDLLGEPDCSDQGPGGVVSNPPTPPGEDPAPPPPPPSTESPDDEGYPPMGRRETPSTSPEGRPGRTITIRTADTLIIQETGENPDGSIIRTTIHRDSQG